MTKKTDSEIEKEVDDFLLNNLWEMSVRDALHFIALDRETEARVCLSRVFEDEEAIDYFVSDAQEDFLDCLNYWHGEFKHPALIERYFHPDGEARTKKEIFNLDHLKDGDWTALV